MGRNLRTHLAIAVSVATVAVGLIGTGVAYADVSFSVPTATGLTDGQSVQISLAGINNVAFATVEVSECANAYADNSALPAFVASSDCEVLERIDVSSSPTLLTSVTVKQSGVGLGNRSCIASGNFGCDLRVTSMANQLLSPLPAPVPIAFAADPAPHAPDVTETSVAVYGAPLAIGKTAYAHVSVDTAGNFVAQGNTTIELDGVPVASMDLDSKGTATIPVGTPALGSHTLDVQFGGNGSFAPSNASSTSFDVVSAKNITVGDVSAVEGDAWMGKVAIPIVLSQPAGVPIAVHYTISPGSADLTTDYTANVVSGTLKFTATQTRRNLFVKINGDTTPESDESLTVTVSAQPSGWDLRRATGVVTILDDDTTPVGLAVGIGDARVPEGDIGKAQMMQIPITLSEPLLVSVKVTVLLSSVSAVHRTPRSAGDWAGPIKVNYLFKPGQVRKNIIITIFPDMVDEPNLTITAAVSAITSTATVGLARATGTGTILSDE